MLGFLLAGPKGFVLGPLALLLFLSRPRSLREWVWILISVVLAVALLRLPASLSDRTIRAAAAFFTGAFVMTSLAGVRSLFNRALASVTFTTSAVAGWFTTMGLGWSDLRESIVSTQWALYRALFADLPSTMPTRGELDSGALAGRVADITRGILTTVDYWPAIHALFAMAGGWLAWMWYHRIASEPIGLAPKRFREFSFSDHLVWLVILSGAALLAGVGGTGRLVAGNLLMFLLALYAGRGLAVIRTALLPAPRALAVLLSITSIVLLPLAMVTATLIGLADTWLDIRRRMAPPEGALP